MNYNLRQITYKGIDAFKKAINKGFLHLLLSNYVIKVFGFASQIFVAWILTPEDIGRIKIWQSYISIAAIMAAFGFNSSILKFCSENRTTREKYSIFLEGMKYSIFPVLITYIAILVCSFFRIISPDKVVNNYIWLFALGLIPITYNANQFSYLQALKRIKEYANIQLFSKGIGVIILIIITYLFSLKGYLISLLIGYLLTSILLFNTIQKDKPTIREKQKNNFKQHFRFASLSTITNFVNTLSQNIDIILLNFLVLSREKIGYYGYAVVFVSFLRILSVSMNQFMVPNFSRQSDNFTNWYSVYKSYKKKWMIASITIFMLSIILVVPFLRFGMSGKYSNSIIFFIILAVAWVIRSKIVLQGNALFGLGVIKINTILGITHLIINLTFQFIFILLYGVIGAAIGLLISEAINLIVGVVVFNGYVKRREFICRVS